MTYFWRGGLLLLTGDSQSFGWPYNDQILRKGLMMPPATLLAIHLYRKALWPAGQWGQGWGWGGGGTCVTGWTRGRGEGNVEGKRPLSGGCVSAAQHHHSNNNNEYLERLTHTGPKCLHILRLTHTGPKCLHILRLTHTGPKCLHILRLTHTGPKCLHILRLTHTGPKCLHILRLTHTGPKCLHILRLTHTGPKCLHILRLTHTGPKCLHILRLTHTGPKRLHVLYKYILSKFNAYNMNTHTHTQTRTHMHACTCTRSSEGCVRVWQNPPSQHSHAVAFILSSFFVGIKMRISNLNWLSLNNPSGCTLVVICVTIIFLVYVA